MRTDRTAADRIFAPPAPWVAWIAVAIWLTVVTCTSLTSSPPGSKWLVVLSRHFHSPAKALRLMQAIIHIGLFGIGSVAVASALATTPLFSSNRKLFALTVVFVTVFGGAIELLQDYVPQRRADFLDLSGDVAGAVLFLSFAWAAGLMPFKRQKREVPR